MHRSNRNAGFTLTELVIAVGIIGLLASLAIPGFMTYQARARRGEAYANVASIARAERGYFSEAGTFYEAPTQPVVNGALLGADTHAWTAAASADFAGLGWEPDGRVRYSYDINTGSTGCGACNDTCFTATAYGDVDNNDKLSAVMYVAPGKDDTGNTIECPSHLFGFGTPLGRNGGGKIFNEVAVHWMSDEY